MENFSLSFSLTEEAATRVTREGTTVISEKKRGRPQMGRALWKGRKMKRKKADNISPRLAGVTELQTRQLHYTEEHVDGDDGHHVLPLRRGQVQSGKARIRQGMP